MVVTGVLGNAFTFNVIVSSSGQLLFGLKTSTLYTLPDIAAVTLFNVNVFVVPITAVPEFKYHL